MHRGPQNPSISPHPHLRDQAKFRKLATVVKGRNWTGWFPKASWAVAFGVTFQLFLLLLPMPKWCPSAKLTVKVPHTYCHLPASTPLLMLFPSAWNTSLFAAPQVLREPQSLSSISLPFALHSILFFLNSICTTLPRISKVRDGVRLISAYSMTPYYAVYWGVCWQFVVWKENCPKPGLGRTFSVWVIHNLPLGINEHSW